MIISKLKSRNVILPPVVALFLFACVATLPNSPSNSASLYTEGPPLNEASRAFGVANSAALPAGSAAPVLSAPIFPFVPSISATKAVTVSTDVDGDGKADPGDTLTYTVTISNSGSDALNLVFTDTIDPNTTLVPGSVNTSPLAFDDSYAAIGNVSISPNAAQGLLANDFDADGNALTVTGNSAPSCGGNLTVNADGSFTFNPPPGFEGSCTFTYTVSDGQTPPLTDTGTVTITVSGMIWFIDNSLGVNGDGRLSSPFNSLGSFAAINDGAGNHPAANDNIFLFRQTATNYGGPLTLLNGQRLIGQGATASLAAITGLTPPAYSAALPSTGGTDPIIAHNATNLTIASGNTLRGFNLSNSGGTALVGTSFGNLAASEVSVSNSSGIAINLNTGNPNASFGSISASGGTNGIILQNTTGSFTVIGSGGTCTEATPTCTGGTISNTTGADNSTAAPVGTAIVLNNVTNVSFTRMHISGNTNYGIRGTSVNGFTFDNGVINGVNGTNVATPFNDSSMRFDNLVGTANITNSSISGGFYRNVQITNTSGSLALTVNNCNIHDTGATQGDDGLFLENQSTANISATITNNTFSKHGGDHFNGSLLGTGTVSYTITGNTLTGGHAIGLGQGIFILAASFNAPGNLTYNISNNGSVATPFTGNNQGAAIFVDKGSGSGSFSGKIENNVIGNPAVVGSGSLSGAGIDVEAHGSGSHATLINNNSVRQFHEDGIRLVGGESTGVTFDATITNNTVSNPDNLSGSSGHGVHINMGTLPADSLTACMDVKSNNLVGAGEDGDNGTLNDSQFDLRIRQRQSASVVVRLPGFAGGADANAFESGQNSLTTVLTSAVTTFGGGAACAAPSLTAADVSVAEARAEIRGRPEEPEPSYTDYLFAPEVNQSQTGAGETVSQSDVISMFQAAIARWKTLGISGDELARLESVQVDITDLPDDQLVVTTLNRILVDETGAQFGWFIDSSPDDSSEFDDSHRLLRADSTSPAFGKLDLLTAITRALGYVLDHAAIQHSTNRQLLMIRTLAPSMRQLPFRSASRSQAVLAPAPISDPLATAIARVVRTPEQTVTSVSPAGFEPSGNALFADRVRPALFRRAEVKRSAVRAAASSVEIGAMSGETVSKTVGTLPANKTVTITFRVTINDPFPADVCSVNNQGTVSGSNFTDVLTNIATTSVPSPPTISCPADLNTSTDSGLCTASVPFTATTTGCPTPTVTCKIGATTITSPHDFPVGTTTVTCTASNGEAPDATCSFDVTVTDNQPPAITCPANITQSTDANMCTAVVSFTASGTDPCGTITPDCTPPSGSTFPKGVTTVTCTASDSSGNTSNCSFTVTVNDTQEPVIGPCPANITKSTDPNLCSAITTFTTPSATDNCPGVGAVTCTPASGAAFPKGTTTVTCTATDESGNTGNCTFTVTVNDTQPPSITCPSNISVVGNAPTIVNYTTPAPADNCPGATASCVPASGSAFPVGTTTVTCTATDTSTNTATCSFTVSVTPCSITCPANVTASTDPGACTAVVAYAAPITTGSCGTITCTPPSGSAFPKGTTTVTCTATAGVSCSFTVTVNDTQPPKITCPATVTAPPGVVTYPDPTVTDNCPGATFTCVPPSGSTFGMGTTTVTCTAQDASGNTASCSFAVTTFDICIQNDGGPGTLLFNSKTGDYIFCCGTKVLTGRATVAKSGCTITLTQSGPDRRLRAVVDTCLKKATASLQFPVGITICTIIDRNITDNSCQCAPAS